MRHVICHGNQFLLQSIIGILISLNNRYTDCHYTDKSDKSFATDIIKTDVLATVLHDVFGCLSMALTYLFKWSSQYSFSHHPSCVH